MLSLNCCKFKQERFMPSSILHQLIKKEPVLIRKPYISPVLNKFSQDNNTNICMLRLDVIHPHLSGNKLFKLHYFLEETLHSRHRTLITFGGAYSNHLAATAFAANTLKLNCIGIVRGERPKRFSETLIFCEKYGMKLVFISREEYQQIAALEENNFLQETYGEHVLIPEGGFSDKGMAGAGEITGLFQEGKYTHICVAVGTATTLAGILKNTPKETAILGFPALKGLKDIPERFQFLGVANTSQLSLLEDYHFGGFGKKTPELIFFMNRFYEENRIPLDFVYTGKMMFGVEDLLQKNYFPAGSDILCIHTGGLQGNSSIKQLLIY